MAFMDGDKRTYRDCYEMVMSILKPGGFILVDNTLWDGHVIDHAYDKDRQTQGIETFNDYIARDARVEQVILPLRDGLSLIRKKIFRIKILEMQETRQNKIARLLQKEALADIPTADACYSRRDDIGYTYQDFTRSEYLHRLSERIPQREGRRDIDQHQCQYQTDTLRVRHSRKKPDAYHSRACDSLSTTRSTILSTSTNF